MSDDVVRVCYHQRKLQTRPFGRAEIGTELLIFFLKYSKCFFIAAKNIAIVWPLLTCREYFSGDSDILIKTDQDVKIEWNPICEAADLIFWTKIIASNLAHSMTYSVRQGNSIDARRNLSSTNILVLIIFDSTTQTQCALTLDHQRLRVCQHRSLYFVLSPITNAVPF